MNYFKVQSRKSQGGFTMVELAIVLVIAGILLIGALKGTDMINKAKIERTVSDIRGIQTMIFEHEKRTGKLAGDCNGDGIIGVNPALITPVRLAGNAYDDGASPILGSSNPGAIACIASGTPEVSIDTPWKDLRKANIIEPGRVNRQVAKNQTNNFYAIGSLAIGAVTPVTTNVITVHEIPLWMAKGIDVAIDGSSIGDNLGTNGGLFGRVRLLNIDAGAATPNGAAWPVNANDDQLVSIYFQFDRAAP